MPTSRFPLGQTVATPGALETLEQNHAVACTFLGRHQSGDWGDRGTADRTENNRAVNDGSRILSAYRLTHGTRIWIITEADRSSSCILLPDEYWPTRVLRRPASPCRLFSSSSLICSSVQYAAYNFGRTYFRQVSASVRAIVVYRASDALSIPSMIKALRRSARQSLPLRPHTYGSLMQCIVRSTLARSSPGASGA